MTDKAFLLEKRYCQHNRRVCLIDSNSDGSKPASFLMPETVILLPPFTYPTDEKNKPPHSPIAHPYGLRSSLRHGNNKTTTTASPGNPTKTVHFNVPLTEVLYFHPLNYQDDEDEENQFEDAFLELYSKNFQMELLDTSFQEMLLEDTAQKQLSIDPLILSILNLSSSSSSSSSWFEHETSSVYLEQLNWDDDNSILRGFVIVRNVAFEKCVIARLTFDDWESYMDINAVYNESPSEYYDRFVFEIAPLDYVIQLKEQRDLLLSLTCQLAIHYTVNGHQYWDNNFKSNYIFQWLKKPI